MEKPIRVMFVYWGRRGISHLVHEIGSAAIKDQSIQAYVSVSIHNELYEKFLNFGDSLFPVRTFETNLGAIFSLWRVPLLRRQLKNKIKDQKIDIVIELMPHIWSSLIMPCVAVSGARYATIVHDASTHPGDYRSGTAKFLLDRAATQADVIFTLTKVEGNKLAANKKLQHIRQEVLFLPDISFEKPQIAATRKIGEPLRLLFMGRIMPYKGLTLLTDALELLRSRGIQFEVGIYGEGNISNEASRLERLGATVVNRWLSDDELAYLLPSYHAIVLSHIEASQSGIVSIALGNGLPVVATPVGGLVEQIEHNVSGLIAKRIDAAALADAIEKLATNAKLYDSICRTINNSKKKRSVKQFVRLCVEKGKCSNKSTKT